MNSITYVATGGSQPRAGGWWRLGRLVEVGEVTANHGITPENMTYGRSDSISFGPTPGTLSKRARLPNAPCCWRHATMRWANAGPIRGSRVISVTSARSRSTRSPGRSGRASRAAMRAVALKPRGPGGGVSRPTRRTSPGAAAVDGASARRTPAPARRRKARRRAARRSSMLHANGSPAGGRDPFYASCAEKLRHHDCGMRNADCGMEMEGRFANPQSEIRNPQLSAHQCHRHITDHLQRRRTHLVDRVFRRVPVRVVEVHHVDRMDAHPLQSHVVVDEGGFDAGQENPAVAQIGGGAPHAVHDLGGERLRVALVVELLVLVRHHVEQHGEEGLVAGGLVAGEVTRA